mmetsp:Transcript_71404/g.113552  ORF Transcript_71404/g.113552 Transcript_71404/m.113552 type:complete len:239 (+) Transcript_71404:108-824(+)
MLVHFILPSIEPILSALQSAHTVIIARIHGQFQVILVEIIIDNLSIIRLDLALVICLRPSIPNRVTAHLPLCRLDVQCLLHRSQIQIVLHIVLNARQIALGPLINIHRSGAARVVSCKLLAVVTRRFASHVVVRPSMLCSRKHLLHWHLTLLALSRLLWLLRFLLLLTALRGRIISTRSSLTTWHSATCRLSIVSRLLLWFVLSRQGCRRLTAVVVAVSTAVAIAVLIVFVFFQRRLC